MVKAKKPVKDSDDGKDVVLGYLRKQNRPYSAVDIFNNLGGTIGKTLVIKALTALAEEAQIHAKANGKQWVYVNKQSDEDAPSKDKLDIMDNDIKILKASIDAIKEENRNSQVRLNQLTSTLRNEDLQAKSKALENEVNHLSSRLKQLQEGERATKLSLEDIQQLQSDLKLYADEWRKRKKIFNRIWCTVTESIQGNIKEFEETVGIETDEMAGVDINAVLVGSSNKR